MTTSTSIGGAGTTISQTLLDTMNGTSSTSSTSSATASTTGAGLQSTFLQLLVTQMQNQDPTSPMDSSQMTSQLAEINTVTGISQLNTSLSSLSTQLNASQETQAALLVGSTVLAPGSSVAVTASTSGSGDAKVNFGVQLANAATDMQVLVKNSAGQIVNTLDLGATPAGTTPVSWTPVDTSGNALPAGTYTITATGTVNGAAGTGTTLTSGTVQSIVQQSNGTAGLVLSTGSTVGLSSVAAIL